MTLDRAADRSRFHRPIVYPDLGIV